MPMCLPSSQSKSCIGAGRIPSPLALKIRLGLILGASYESSCSATNAKLSCCGSISYTWLSSPAVCTVVSAINAQGSSHPQTKPLDVACSRDHVHAPWSVSFSASGWQFSTASEAEYPLLLCCRFVGCIMPLCGLPSAPPTEAAVSKALACPRQTSRTRPCCLSTSASVLAPTSRVCLPISSRHPPP